MITGEEKRMLIELICNEQTHMIIKDHSKYRSDKYNKLEKLKVKIKNMEVNEQMKLYKVKDLEKLFKVIDSCEGKIELVGEDILRQN